MCAANTLRKVGKHTLTTFPCKEPRIEKIGSVKEEVETVGEVQVEEFEQVEQAQKELKIEQVMQEKRR